MRKTIIAVYVLLVSVLCNYAYGIELFPSDVNDEIGQTYKQQLDYYNMEIGRAHAISQVSLEAASKAIALGSLSHYDKYHKEYEVLNNKKELFKEKRRELKIKVLEKYGSLPSWWYEPELNPAKPLPLE